MAAKSITIDVGAEFIKICETQKNKKMVLVHQAITVATPEGAVEDGFVRDVSAVADTIRNAMYEHQLQAKAVTFVINTTRVASKEVVLPYMPKEKVQEMVNMNAADYFPINIEDYVMSFTILESTKAKTDNKTRILVFAAPEIMIQSYYTIGQMLGLAVKAVDYAGNSTLQLIKIQVDNAPTLVAQIGMDNTVVSIMYNGVLQLQRTIPYGESLVVNAVKDAKKMTGKAAVELLGTAQLLGETLDSNEFSGSLKFLLANINRVIEYYSGRNKEHPIQKILIVGEGAQVQGMDKLVGNETSLATESLDLLKNVDSYNKIKLSNTLLKHYMTNIGASLDPINFRLKGDEKKAAINHGDKQYILVGLVLVAVAVLLTALPTMQNGALNIKKASLKSKIEKIKHIEKVVAEYDAANAKFTDANNFYISTENDAEDTVKFIEELEQVMPSSMKFSSFSISGGTANIAGSCAFKPEVADFIISLEANERVTNVTLSNVSEADGGVTFNCTVTFVKMAEAESEGADENTEAATDETEAREEE